MPPRAKLLRREIFVWTAAGPPLMNLRNSEALGQILRKTVSIFVDRKTGWTRPGFAVLQNPECSRCLERSGQRDFGTNFSKILCEDTLDFCKSRYMISESLRVEPRAHLGASQCVCRHSRNPAHQATRCTATTQPQAAAHPGGQSAALSGGCAVVLHDGGLTVQISAWSAPTVAHTTVRAGMRTAGCGTAARAGRGALPSRCAGGAQ